MNKLGKGHWGWVTACLVVLLSVLVVQPPGALGAHYPASGDDSNCSSCHTLDANEGDQNTSYIANSARTFPQIKANDGLPVNQAPQYLGCTFCHYLNTNTAMKPILGHFQGKLSFHPVGVNFTTDATTGQIYTSSYLSNKPNELDCVDCHDIDLGKPVGAPNGYPLHDNRPANNPYMLRSVTAIGEYDALCRTCHRSDAPVVVKTVSMQLTKHADGAAGRPLVEDDGTVLRTNDLNQDGIADPAGIVDQCRVCHDTHYSTKYKLLSDGHETHKVGAGEVADTPIVGDGNNCTTICHYPGDNNNLASGGNFGKYGHGKAESTYKYKNFRPDSSGAFITMGMNCASCHVSLDLATKPHVEPVPSGANDREKYKNRFNLNIPLQIGDTTGSAYGNPIYGVCFQCHSGYAQHIGAGSNVGCQDCHDEHAEGSGTTSNVFMIPERSKVEGAGCDGYDVINLRRPVICGAPQTLRRGNSADVAAPSVALKDVESLAADALEGGVTSSPDGLGPSQNGTVGVAVAPLLAKRLDRQMPLMATATARHKPPAAALTVPAELDKGLRRIVGRQLFRGAYSSATLRLPALRFEVDLANGASQNVRLASFPWPKLRGLTRSRRARDTPLGFAWRAEFPEGYLPFVREQRATILANRGRRSRFLRIVPFVFFLVRGETSS